MLSCSASIFDKIYIGADIDDDILTDDIDYYINAYVQPYLLWTSFDCIAGRCCCW